MELLFMEPVFKEAIWGGTKLRDVFGYEIPSDTTGECWAVSAHKNGDCRIAGGMYDGRLLSSLWEEKPELFGNYPGDQFPLLVKIIDAKADLSIQVHPDDEYAKVHEDGSLGKTECWYILDCDPGTEIVIGHHAGSHEEMEAMIRGHQWDEFIRKVPVKKGDFFQINPGCVHAIKGGTLILETQQSSILHTVSTTMTDCPMENRGSCTWNRALRPSRRRLKRPPVTPLRKRYRGLCTRTSLRVRSILWTSMRSTACLPGNSAGFLPMSA